jgi:very-short-patch-repair endonuclease
MIPLARHLRKEQTPAEEALWERLRDRRFLGLKFKRRKPIGRFVLDFYCAEKGAGIELDGYSHVGKEAYDKERQCIIEGAEIRIIRFTNNEVLRSIDTVLCILRQFVSEYPNPMSPSPMIGRRVRDEG